MHGLELYMLYVVTHWALYSGKEYTKKTNLISIDHHRRYLHYYSLNIIKSQVSSAVEILYFAMSLFCSL